MAGTVVISEKTQVPTVKLIKLEWTSDASGDADATTTTAIDGECLLFGTDPSGASAPTDNYDITITDEDGLDVLVGAGADRDTANIEYVQGSSLGVCAGTKLTITVSNAGSSKSGVAYLFVR